MYQLGLEQVNEEQQKSYLSYVASESSYTQDVRLFGLGDMLKERFRAAVGAGVYHRKEKGKAEEQPPQLTVAYISGRNILDSHLLENAEITFRRKYPDIELTVESKFSNEYITQLNAELMGGRGPDLIYISAEELDLNRMARTGSYADLSSFVDNAVDLKKYPYVEAALEAGRINGKQYVI